MECCELRRQQLRLGLLRAARVLLAHQSMLRRVLSRPLPPDLAPPHGDLLMPGEAADSSQVEEEGEHSSGPTLILHQVLAAATQPSPLKALFAREEMEVRIVWLLVYQKS